MSKTIFLLCICLLVGYGLCNGPAVKFDLPEESVNAYIGNLFKHESLVKLSPKLRAFTNKFASRTNRICGFHPIVKDDLRFPFEVDLKDSNLGTGEIRVRNDVPVDFTQGKMYTFQIEAYDCDSPPNYSERVLVQVNIRAEEQLRFAEPEYNFSVVTYSSVGAICGKVTVMHESFNHQIDGNNQCGYSLLAGDMVPFTVDSHGVIRTREVLTKDSPKIYIFRVQYRDCGVLRVETVTAVVNIKVIENSCEPRWKGLPQSVYYSLAEPQPKRLLWPQSYTLEMCGMTCEDSPRIVTQVSLNHGRPDMTLYPANPAFCRHDPRSLYEQRKLCDIDELTLVNLLPDPKKDIMEQHISPAVGALPEVVPLSLALRFSSAVGTGWRLDTPRLLAAAKAAQDQVMGGMFPRPKIIPSNLFERDFTLSFWLQREPKNDDDHESILCSQEDTATVGRALWISLKGCRIMVQMITRNPQTNQPLIDKVFRTYFFPRLPPSVCNPDGLTEGSQPWHHYSISITIDPETVEPTASTLMVDGESVGTLEQFGDTILVKRQSSEFFSQFITVGTCYDPSVPGSQQSLNGAIAGMTLLLGRNEDQSVSRCLAECGETLLIPRASSLITDNVNVILNSDNIVIESATSAEAAALLSNVAYVKPESTSTQLTYEPAGSNDRVLELSTTYRCGGRQLGNITTEKIALILQGSYSDLGDSAIAEAPDASAWMPKNEMRVPPQLKPQAPTALVLSILGQDVIRANIPVFEPGITMFPALEFTFSNVPFYAKSVARSAAMFVLDQCLVLPVNGSGLDFNDGERIVWPAGRAFELGVAVEPTQMGVLLKGRQTANQYASLLHGFRYWPPIEIEKRTNDMSLASGLLMERKFQLICSYNDAGYNTDPFTVQILLSSPVIAAETRAGKGVVYSDSSRDDTSLVNDNYLDNPYDDDDDDEDFDEEDDEMMQGDDPSAAETGQWPPPSGTVKRLDPSPAYKSAMGVAQFAHSDKEVRSGDSLRLQKKQKLEEGGPSKVNNFGLAVGLGVGGLAVVIIILAFFITKSTGFRRGQLSFFRRVDRKGTGRIQFRPEARLNVIENPIENLEGGRLNWQPPTTVPPPTMSEGLPSLPGVHGAYGGRDEQFDAETRSFNGLFEEEEEEGAAAVLEEVDDFDESEAVMTQTMERVDEDDEEGASDQEDETSFSMGPNHLEFVTLPDPRRGFNADV